MKIIVSHDVDHLFFSDHLQDLIYPKLWVRESLRFARRDISCAEWIGRISTTFCHKRHHINELMAFDCLHHVPSTFFFGMAQGLGMSYKAGVAKPVAENVMANGFSVGIHGVAFQDKNAIQREYARFKLLFGQSAQGIRMHYVRFDQDTFKKLDSLGYLYDSTEFDKTKGYCVKAPYRIGTMWEFPLTLMDGYLPYPFELAKAKTLEILSLCDDAKLPYATVLLHDYMFSSPYKETKHWYEWLIEYCEDKFGFVSFENAVKELQQGGKI